MDDWGCGVGRSVSAAGSEEGPEAREAAAKLGDWGSGGNVESEATVVQSSAAGSGG